MCKLCALQCGVDNQITLHNLELRVCPLIISLVDLIPSVKSTVSRAASDVGS